MTRQGLVHPAGDINAGIVMGTKVKDACVLVAYHGDELGKGWDIQESLSYGTTVRILSDG